jgi:hypothetical protein
MCVTWRSLCLGGENSGPANRSWKKLWSWLSLGFFRSWDRNFCMRRLRDGLPEMFLFCKNIVSQLLLSSEEVDEDDWFPLPPLAELEDRLLLPLLLLQQGSDGSLSLRILELVSPHSGCLSSMSSSSSISASGSGSGKSLKSEYCEWKMGIRTRKLEVANFLFGIGIGSWITHCTATK